METQQRPIDEKTRQNEEDRKKQVKLEMKASETQTYYIMGKMKRIQRGLKKEWPLGEDQRKKTKKNSSKKEGKWRF
jgi:hypothetical protein